MNQEDYDNLDQYDRSLYNYVHQELNIYDLKTFDKLCERYSNKETTIAYRGMNFSTEEEYNLFLEKIKENKGFKSSSAAGFSRSFKTAEGFAMTVKTYYPTLEVMIEEQARRLTGEEITGYKGVVIEIEIPKNQGIDTHESDFGIEDEILIAPDRLYTCKIREVLSFKDRIKNIDINDYISNIKEEDLHRDKLLKYIIINKNNKLNEENQEKLFNSLLIKKEKFLNNLKRNKLEIIEAKDNLIIHNSYRYNRWTEDPIEEIEFIVPDFFSYDRYNIFTEKHQEKIKDITDSVLLEIMDYYLNNKDKKYDLSGVKNLTGYASHDVQSLYMRMVQEVSNEKGSYNELQDKMVHNVNIKSKTKEEKEKAIKEGAEDIKNYLQNLLNNLPIDRETLEKEKLEIKRRREEAIEKLSNIKRKRRF